ncbi:hypothetical protein VV02_21475 [Luteipulveratus mongoliensis]|uniref:Lipoprotein n=1 Tax=Luteipulveratus mongoliensis TaxID=571913 RepID=A0A0K1JM87_9MICO|nr:hypothetical protein VV02_21475 [Luteipulveratus mongoliensis]
MAAPALALTVVTALAACGDVSAPGAGPSRTTKASPTATATAVRATPPAPPTAGQKVDSTALFTRVNAAMAKAKYVRVVMDAPAGDEDMRLDQLIVSPTRNDLRMDMGRGDEMRVIDGVIFMKSPEISKKWIRIDASSKNPFAQIGFASLQGAAGQGPGAQLELMRHTQSTSEGPELVGGVRTTRYAAKVPFSLVLEQQLSAVKLLGGANDPEMKRELATVRKKTAGKHVGYRFWLDQQDRLVKVTVDFGSVADVLKAVGDESAEDKDMPDSMTISYTRWGVPFSIIQPPASQVESADKAFARMPGPDSETGSGSYDPDAVPTCEATCP